MWNAYCLIVFLPLTGKFASIESVLIRDCYLRNPKNCWYSWNANPLCIQICRVQSSTFFFPIEPLPLESKTGRPANFCILIAGKTDKIFYVIPNGTLFLNCWNWEYFVCYLGDNRQNQYEYRVIPAWSEQAARVARTLINLQCEYVSFSRTIFIWVFFEYKCGINLDKARHRLQTISISDICKSWYYLGVVSAFGIVNWNHK